MTQTNTEIAGSARFFSSLLGGPGAGTRGVMALGTAQRNVAAALAVGQNFNDARVLVMVVVVAVVGLLILIPLARILGARGAEQPAYTA